MSVLLEFSIFPTGRGESVSFEVSEVIRMIRDSGHDYQLTAMGTLIETDDLHDALALVEQAYAVLQAQGCQRVYSSIKLDIRPGKTGRIHRKIASVEARIGQTRHTDP